MAACRHAIEPPNLTELLVEGLARRASVRCQLPLLAVDESEPEPDIAVVQRSDKQDHPSQAHLVIEVADTSLRYDRLAKRALYAESGFPEFWIVDVERRRVEVYREPKGDGSASCTVVEADGAAVIAAFPDVRIAVAAMFEAVR